tara:strand:+ start:510 stop:875 length:366 start_codon:yes stop_codon:yes gene_type:complete
MKRVFIAWLSGLLLISGCAPAAFDIDKAVFETQISKVYEGMSFTAFQDLFPQRISRGGHQHEKGMITAFEVAYDYYSFYSTGNERRNTFTGTERVVTWFFFQDGRLIRYGEPDSWPAGDPT